jgi:hypothetical protein
MRAMVRRAFLVLVMTVATAATAGGARADGGPFGLGLILGSPTGVSGKLYFNRQNAIDFAVGEAFANERGFHFHLDYLWHPFMLAQDEGFSLPFYLGIGGRILSRDGHAGSDLHLGARAPFGILFDFKRVPLDVFVEVAIIVDIIHNNDDDLVDLNAGVGIRYYF